MKTYLLSLILIFITLNANAQDAIETDRPDQTETVSTVPKGRLQSESGITHTQTERNGSENTMPETLWKFGITDKVEVRLSTDLLYFKNSDSSGYGLEPVKIGLKVNMWHGKGLIPETTLLVQAAVPKVASKKLQAKYLAPEIRLLFENDLSDNVQLGYNLGAEWDGESAEPVSVYTCSSDFVLSDKLETFIEVFGFMPQKDRSNHWVDGGFKYLINQNIQVDISGGYELTSNNHYHGYFESLGFSFRI